MRLSFLRVRSDRPIDQDSSAARDVPKAIGRRFRPVLALVMVSVATLGAAAAYWAADAEQETILLNQRLINGRLLEVARWSQRANQYGTWNFYILMAKAMLHSASSSHVLPMSYGNLILATAAKLDLQAQEQFSASRLFQTFRSFLAGSDELNRIAKDGPDASLAFETTSELQAFGYGLGFQERENKGSSADDLHQSYGDNRDTLAPAVKIWKPLERRLEEVHNRVLRFSTAVALFVLALVFFTFAERNQRVL